MAAYPWYNMPSGSPPTSGILPPAPFFQGPNPYYPGHPFPAFGFGPSPPQGFHSGTFSPFRPPVTIANTGFGYNQTPRDSPDIHKHQECPRSPDSDVNDGNISPGSPESELLDLDKESSPKDGSTSSKYPDYCKTITVKDASGHIKELVFPKALDLDRPKRARTTFTPEQLSSLEREFLLNQYLIGRERTDLAKRLGLSETQVKVWFQNRRTKFKRDKSREVEVEKTRAESSAACNILRLLQDRHPAAEHTAGSNPPHLNLGSSALPSPSRQHGSGTERYPGTVSPPRVHVTPYTPTTHSTMGYSR